MSLPFLLTLAALAGSVVLLISSGPRALALVAAIVAALEVLMARGWVHIGVRGLPLALILGAALTVLGVILWTRTAAKHGVSAATVVAAVGVLQVLSALHLA